jgi:CRISPR-associated endonuclease/helicase Cas3
LRTFREILNSAPDITVTLTGHKKYWAHIHPSKIPELLYEHINLVNRYALLLVEEHGLDKVIDNLITAYIKDWGSTIDATFLKELFVHTIIFHDFGKINENFQVSRMRNSNFTAFKNATLKPPHGHSFLGAFLFLSHHIDQVLRMDIVHERRVKLICHCFFFAYTIMQHHSPALYDVTKREGFMLQFKRSVSDLKRFAMAYGIRPDEQLLDNIFSCIDDIWHQSTKKKLPYVPFPLFALIKLNFSLLTAADYLATHEYMNRNEKDKEIPVIDLGAFKNRKRVIEIVTHLRNHKHNAHIFNCIDGYKFTYPTEKSNKNLNLLRQEMAVELVVNIRKNLDNYLFYLEAPTGGGKTNLSAIAVTELLEAHNTLTKVFYVFPFTTLITQTFSALKEGLGLNDNEIVELHSKSPFASRAEASEDGLFGGEKKDFIDNLFALFPVTLMSHVKFFEILKTNKKEPNYLLHRLANSIVVIDEIQSYNPDIWDKMLYFINNYARFFNIRFILMSATLPKISDLKVGLTQTLPFVELLPNARKYILNPNFSERVSFNFELLLKDEISLETLAEFVVQRSRVQAEKTGYVRTIVEFIYKNSASAFYQLLTNIPFFDKIFVLSGTVLEPRRREIINSIKRTANHPENILLITTQVVEAGVDIDMDLGFKNVSLLDSDEQLAGRVNRNASKDGCEVYLFKVDNASVLYGNDYRYIQTRKHINITLHQEILKTKDFKRLYENVLLHIDDLNHPHYKNSITGYEEYIADLRYADIDKNFQIIDQESNLVFVPLKIPIQIKGCTEGEVDDIFTKSDLSFLQSLGIPQEECLTNEEQSLLIDGEKVWKLYKQFIEKQTQSRQGNSSFNIKQKIDFKMLQSIMAKFSFSLVSHSKDYRKIQEGFGVEEYGYMYFSHWNDERENGKPYDYKIGLNANSFSDSNFI